MNREMTGRLRTVRAWGYRSRCGVLTAALTLCLAPLAHVHEERAIASHCPHDAPSAASHCAWHCGGLDSQSGGGEGEVSADIHVSRLWSLGHISLQDAVPEGEFPPRGPPHVVRRTAKNMFTQGAGCAPVNI